MGELKCKIALVQINAVGTADTSHVLVLCTVYAPCSPKFPLGMVQTGHFSWQPHYLPLDPENNNLWLSNISPTFNLCVSSFLVIFE